jgi:hypothetical protein
VVAVESVDGSSPPPPQPATIKMTAITAAKDAVTLLLMVIPPKSI